MKMKKLFKSLAIAVTLLAMLLTASSCAKSYENAGDAQSPKYENLFTGNSADKETVLLDESLDLDRKIIKNVNESVQTDQYDAFLTDLNEAVALADGYISSANYSGENYFNTDNLRHANLTVRIPAEKLSEFTEKVDSIAVVTYYNESLQDVTAAYVDVESRISVLKAEESALLEILKNVSTTADALDVRTRLLDVQADLASLNAQKEAFDDRIAYSTVYINISEVRRAKEQNPGFFTEIGNTFLDSIDDIGDGVRDFAVWFLGNILYVVIFGGVLTGAFFFVRFALRRVKSKKKVSENKIITDASEEQ